MITAGSYTLTSGASSSARATIWTDSTTSVVDYSNYLVQKYKFDYGNTFDCWTQSNTSSTTVYKPSATIWQDSGCSYYSYTKEKWITKQKSPLERLKEIIQQRHSPQIIIVDSKRPMSLNADIREQRARETLSRLIGQERYLRFLKSGFVSAKNAMSGKVYQIFPGHGITKVFENGVLKARLCVVLNGDFPPTDSVIVRYLLALNDEEKLWSLAIQHSISIAEKKPLRIDDRSLADIFGELKSKVA